MSRWVVKSARYNYGQAGWYAYRADEFDTTATHFGDHLTAFAYAENRAEEEWENSFPPLGFIP